MEVSNPFKNNVTKDCLIRSLMEVGDVDNQLLIARVGLDRPSNFIEGIGKVLAGKLPSSTSSGFRDRL